MNAVAVMVSGGLDSFIAIEFAKSLGYRPLPLFVDYGQPYTNKEIESLNKNKVEYEKVKVEGFINKKVTPDDWIVPGRNLLLAMFGAIRAGRVWIGALDGEMHKYAREKDKTPEFFYASSALLTYVLDIIRPDTIIETPFKYLTKTEVVAWAISHGITKEQLLNTSSCYDEQDINCGVCSTCFKRWVAMKNNGIEEAYKRNPVNNAYGAKTVFGMKQAYTYKKFTHYSLKRCLETFKAIGYKPEGVK